MTEHKQNQKLATRFINSVGSVDQNKQSGRIDRKNLAGLGLTEKWTCNLELY